MHLITFVLTALSTGITTTFVTAASLRETCGAGKVISISTFPFEDVEITVTETECPGFAINTRSTSNSERAAPEQATHLDKRDITQCSDNSCKVYCQDTGNQPFLEDCENLSFALYKEYPAMFVVNPQTMVFFNYTTCAFGFGNLDAVAYDVCYGNFAYNGVTTANDCFGDYPAPQATPGGFCLDPNSKWGIEVFNPQGQIH